MKTIGLIGGMSWESSAIYYELLNKKTNEILGGFTSSKCLMYSVDFAEIEALQHSGNWEALNRLMADAASKLYDGGADIIVLCTNTMHLCSNAISKAVPIPFLHIADATGDVIESAGLRKVGLLGTKFTMEKDFYKKFLHENYGIEIIIPRNEDRDKIHKIIYKELVQGIIKSESKDTYISIIKKLQDEGAEGIILGCTEIPLLISEDDVDVPLFDTTRIHAEKAVELALN